MANGEQNIWQIGTGEAGRRYDDLFLKYDVMLIGPGGHGTYDQSKYADAYEADTISKREWDQVARFYHQVQDGDLVVARRGHEVFAVGIVADAEVHHDTRFDDIHGWDVSHYRRVAWLESASPQLIQLQSNASSFFSHLRSVATLNRADATVLGHVNQFLPLCKKRDLKPLPEEPPEVLNDAELASELFNRGVSHSDVTQVVQAIGKVRNLIRWYQSRSFRDYRPTEHEVVAHLILPIMLSLGWSEQLLAIEWGKRDLAAFSDVPTNYDNCKLVVEAKSMSHGLKGVVEQAISYTENLPNCDKILVTNGLRNFIYTRKSNDAGEYFWDTKSPCNYFNLAKLRKAHLCYPGTNAIDAIVSLKPSSVSRSV